jgi:iron complex transport system ATP-binding protein
MSATALTIDRVTLAAGGRELVRDLSFAVNAGERWVLLGPNGAGKSTLLAALAGVRAPDAGHVRLGSDEVSRLSAAELAQRRALMTDRWLDPFAATVLDTVRTARYRFAARAGRDDAPAEHDVAQALAALDCAALATHDVRSLSRGERQRVALATALAQRTPLLLLDEPTAHQDPRHQALVLGALERLNEVSMVASLHDMNAAAHFATHALLLSGRGTWRAGPAAEVLTAANLSELFDARVLAAQHEAGTVFYLANGTRGAGAEPR